MFSIFTYSEYRKHGCLKISDFKHLSSEYRKLRFKKIRGFQTSVFSIFSCSEYRKHGCLKISDFLKSKFSIFTIGEYRKHGFIKVGEKNPWYPRYPRNLRFRPGRQLPFIPSYFLCYGKQVTIVTEGYFYISAVWRCKRPRFGIEVTVDLASNFCVWLLG